MTGIKHDETKIKWSLLPWDVMEEVAEVMQHGAEKYGLDNWKHVDPPMRYWDAAMRHMIAFRQGEKLDESTLHHLAHAITSLIFLLWHDNKNWDRVLTEALQEVRNNMEDMK
jgi:hypothetical protein